MKRLRTDFDEISWRGRTWPIGTNKFNFGDDPDHRPDPGVRSPKCGFTGLSIMLVFGGGLRSVITSSFLLNIKHGASQLTGGNVRWCRRP